MELELKTPQAQPQQFLKAALAELTPLTQQRSGASLPEIHQIAIGAGHPSHFKCDAEEQASTARSVFSFLTQTANIVCAQYFKGDLLLGEYRHHRWQFYRR